MTALILAVFLGAAVIAIPIAHALLVAALAAAATSDRVPLELLVQQMVEQVQSFPLIAIPFSMLTGTLMMGGKLGEALIGVLSTLIGRFHGGPGLVGVLSSTIFGGVSGSAVADASVRNHEFPGRALGPVALLPGLGPVLTRELRFGQRVP